MYLALDVLSWPSCIGVSGKLFEHPLASINIIIVVAATKSSDLVQSINQSNFIL